LDGRVSDHPTHEVPELGDLLAGLHVVSIPMRVRFRGVELREAALLHGPSGWGEFSPFLEYEPAEASRWLGAAVEAAYRAWPAPRRTTVPVNATVPAVGPERVPEVLARFDGATTAKVKVAERGQSVQDDVDRVAAVRDAMGRQGRIRVDANGGWTVDEAVEVLRRLAPYGLEYAEQPCATVEELAELRRALARAGVEMLVAADESIRKAEDPLRVAREGAADLVVVKVAPLGGVRRALEVVEACGLPAVVSSAPTPPSAWRQVWHSPEPCPSSTTPAGSGPSPSSPATWRTPRSSPVAVTCPRVGWRRRRPCSAGGPPRRSASSGGASASRHATPT
jgi:O-succinylbenzoate synthase